MGRCRYGMRRASFHCLLKRKDVLGERHPYLQEVTHDLIKVCHHPDAGDLTFCGWRVEKQPISFPIENGAHAGPGREETNAFCHAACGYQFDSKGPISLAN